MLFIYLLSRKLYYKTSLIIGIMYIKRKITFIRLLFYLWQVKLQRIVITFNDTKQYNI